MSAMFKFLEIREENRYNALSLTDWVPLTQTWFFGQWQEMMGRKVRRFEIIKDSEIIGFFQIVKYPLIFSKNFLYIPHGPVIKENIDGDFFKKFREELIHIAQEENAVFARFDFLLPRQNFDEHSVSFSKYFRKIPPYAYKAAHFQPKYEWILNLKKSEEEILADMHQKTRYNINFAMKKDVKISIINGNFNEYFNYFYKLIKETAKRDNFNLHPKNYYENIFKTLNSDNAFLAIAKYSDRILSINLILLFSGMAYFLYGGSGGELKNLMAPHLTHWESIKESKNRKFKFYNFGAVNGKGFEGISRFKKGFNGSLLEYSDSYDLFLNPFWYYLYNLRKLLQ